MSAGKQSQGSEGGVNLIYELVIDVEEGSAHLTCGGEVVWSSDEDADFTEEFDDDFIDIENDDQCDEIVDWLCEQGYVPPGVEVEYVDLADSIDSLDAPR
jgi:hypothetical protein